ncbi:MAG: glycoside hydrolase family 113 [Ktedonobacteraceae bacterium]
MFTSGAVLIAVIAAIFVFFRQSYSDPLPHMNVGPVKATQPVVVHPIFERGVTYPQWSPNGYGAHDTVWQKGVAKIKGQTGARWIEITVPFSQPTSSSSVVQVSQSTPNVQAFIEGIQRLHALGYKVFFVPLIQVIHAGEWSGSINFQTQAQAQTWFTSYWNTIQPYVIAAADNHVEQMAIGTELQTLQQTVSDSLWDQLITNIRSVYKNTLTYDMNWSSLSNPIAHWLKNPDLTYIGVSTYIPLENTPVRVDPEQMPALWQTMIKTQLDAFAIQLGKQVLISEIGYRNSTDALYQTWLAYSKAHSDPTEQAGAYNAALSNVLGDAHIAGTFFWGWTDVGMFAIAGQPAVQTLLKWYTLKQA